MKLSKRTSRFSSTIRTRNDARSLVRAAGHGHFENLEPRQLMALIGSDLLELPIGFYNSTGQTAYDASTGSFDVSATPITIFFEDGPRDVVATDGDFQIHARIGPNGAIIRGAQPGDTALLGSVDAAGDDLVIRGGIDLDNNGSIDPLTEQGILLTGELAQFGFVNNDGPTDNFDYRFVVTGGILASYFAGKDAGVIQTGEESTMADDFLTSFTSEAKGFIGPTPAPLPSSISGHVYCDGGAMNGMYDSGEEGLATTLRLTGTDEAGRGVDRTVSTNPDGSYLFDGLRPGTYTITEAQPAGTQDSTDNAGSFGGTVGNDIISNIVVPGGSDGVGYDFGEICTPPASSISGYVYHDLNNDGTFQGTENPIPGTLISLTGTNDLGQSVSLTTTTDANGFYIFGNLRPGTYQLNETQPAGYLDGKDTIGTPGGSTSNDQFANILLPAGYDGVQNNFGEVLASSISGYVYYDQNNDGTFQGTEAPIPGTTVTLTGTDDLGNPVSLTATTNAAGYYFFGGLRAGTYQLNETQPAAYLDGKDTIGTPGGSTSNDQFANILLPFAYDGVQNNFGEILASSISGYVYYDQNNDGTFQGTEAPIPGTTITLIGTDDLGNFVSLNTTTDANGFYIFGNLRPGTYQLTETQPAGYLDGKDTIGTPGGSTSNDQFSNILLPAGFNGVQNNFGEILASSISGYVYYDQNNDGTFQGTEAPIPGTTITLIGTDDLGNFVSLNTTTDANGFYIFGNLRPGTYQLTETQPAGYLDGKDTIGTPGGSTSNDQFSNILLPAGFNGVQNNFGEVLAFIDIEKYVNSVQQPTSGGEGLTPGYWKQTQHFSQWYTYTQSQNYNSIFGLTPAQEDSSLTMLGALGRGGGANAALGRHAAAALLNAANPNISYAYTTAQIIAMVQNAYATGSLETTKNLLAVENEKEADLTPGGSTSTSGGPVLPGFGADADTGPGPTFVEGSTAKFTFVVTNPGVISLANVVVVDDNETPGNTADDYNPMPVLSGSFNIGDENQNSVLDPGEAWLYCSTKIVTAGQHTNVGSVAGTPINGSGTVLGPAVRDTDAANYNAGVLQLSSISGYVYYDQNNDGTFQGTESPIPGTTVTLTGTNDLGQSVSLTTTTNASGFYSFGNLRPGTYQLTETQPAGYLDGKDTIGTPGGSTSNDQFSNILLPAGFNGINNNFGELKALGSISGTKWLDETGNGLTADDTGFGGVTIYIDANNNGTKDSGEVSTVTASNGTYSFTGLSAGTYVIREVVPANYVRTAPTLSDKYTVTLTTGQTVTGIDFANAEKCDKNVLSSYEFLINGTTVVSDLRGNTNQGDEVTVTFTVAAGYQPHTITLVSYTAPGPTFVAADAYLQRIYDVATGVFGPGTYSLTVIIPDSNYQIDFVCGSAIDIFGPAGSNIFYTPQMRLFSADNDGTAAVVANASSISGNVYIDKNDNGVFDNNEVGIQGVSVTLTGTDIYGKAVSITKQTYSDGSYTFGNLKAGTYTVTESQPSAYLDGKDTKGTLGGTVTNDKIAGIVLAANVDALNYNFGEKIAAGTTLGAGSTATIGFWQNKNGQNLIKSLNGSSSSKNLGNWLSSNFPNLFGSSAGSANNLTNKTNSEVAAAFKTKFAVSGMKIDAQVFAVALATYATNSTLAGGTYAATYGFSVSTSGTGAKTFSVGSAGSALGVANNSVMTIMDILKKVNSVASGGTIFSSNSTNRSLVNNLLDAINQAGDIL